MNPSISINYLSKRNILDNVPIFPNHADLGLLVARHHVHENPIRSKWRFTVSSRSATRRACCGMGVS